MIAERVRAAPAAAIAVGAAALGYLAVVNPHDPSAAMPHCPTKLLTGLDCPLCGGLRMTHDLLHGDLGAAAHDNLFLLAALPVLAWWLLRTRGHRAPPRAALWTIVVLATVWTVVRNLPVWPLHP